MQPISPFTNERPWGNFRQFTFNETSTVKIITVKSGEALSLQKHGKRHEFWRILTGTPSITIDTTETQAKAGDEFFIQAGQAHRIAAQDEEATLLEISFGEFDEQDITRLEDKYGRV